MKATLEFNTEEPEDQQELLRCVKNLDLTLAIWDTHEMIRLLWRGKTVVPEGKDPVDHIHDEWMDILDGYNINLDKLIT